MPFVNDASIRYRFENCSLCAVGGVLGLRSSRVAAGVVARLNGFRPTDPAYQGDKLFIVYADRQNIVSPAVADSGKYGDLQRQLYGIKGFLAERGKTTALLGTVNAMLSVGELATQTGGDANGTKYVVFLNHPNGYDAHFNYAEKEGGTLVFYDFQTDYDGGTGAKISASPILPQDHITEDASRLVCVAIRCT
jgi:hypothetical protein